METVQELDRCCSKSCHSPVADSLCNSEWLKRTNWPDVKCSPHPISIADLFCGCGGLTLGILAACDYIQRSLQVKFAIDFSSEAIDVYKHNFKNYIQSSDCSDVKSIFSGALGDKATPSESRLLSKVKTIDILLAGPPCQGHSDLINLTRRNDPRNELYFSCVRAVEVLRPKIVIIENVATAVLDKLKVVERSNKGLESLGYQTEELVIDTNTLGVAQTRKRHILVAYRANVSLCIAERLSHNRVIPATVRDAIDCIVNLLP